MIKPSACGDFLVALGHGMSPANGIGIGIDRLCMMLLGYESNASTARGKAAIQALMSRHALQLPARKTLPSK